MTILTASDRGFGNDGGRESLPFTPHELYVEPVDPEGLRVQNAAKDSPSSATLRIQLFSYLSISYGDHPFTDITTPRLQSLLAYLLLHRGAPQSRQHVAYLFWPDASETQARHNLRQLLHELRRLLPYADRFLGADASAVSWRTDPNTTFTLDVADFKHALAEAAAAEQRGDATGARTTLTKALALYRGDLLPSCYDDWIIDHRDSLHAAWVDAHRQLMRLLEEQREYAAAIPYAQQLMDLDPLDESRCRDLMRLHACNSDPAAVRRAYRQCAQVLRTDLGIEPSTPTREFYERLLDAQPLGIPKSPGGSPGTPSLVGRGPEWEQLRSSWRRASDGEAHLVLIEGEAGIGKTRLAEELLTWVNHQGFPAARTRCYAAEGGLALSPVTEWLRADAIRGSTTRLADVWLTEVARVLPELLAERPNLTPPEPMTEYGHRQRFFEALARAVFNVPLPLLLLIDDLQWCDQETLEWLHFFLRFSPGKRLLLVGTLRMQELEPSDAVNPWLARAREEGRATEFVLKPLDAVETAQLGAQITKHELDDQSAARLYRETEGHPLFVVEMARAGLSDEAEEPRSWEDGFPVRPSRTAMALPPRIHAVIAGRLAQLSPAARELTGLAASVGRVFTLDVLAAASGTDITSLTTQLNELWQRGLLRAAGTDNSYDFSHDKIRDVAYAELSPMKQRYWHQRIADALKEIHRDDLNQVSAQLAAHYERAGMTERAIPLYQHAAEVAQQVYAHQEAIGLLQHDLVLLHNLSDTKLRAEQQLSILVLLSLSLVATLGYGAPEVLDVLSRAQTLNRQLGKPPHPLLLRALAIAYLNASDFRQSRNCGEQLLRLAEDQHDPILQVEGHYVLGVTLFWTGAFAPSSAHLQRALAHYDPAQSRAHIARYSQDPQVICLCRLAFNLWCRGFPDQARAAQREGLIRARALSHPFSLAYALIWDAMLHGVIGNVKMASNSIEAATALSAEHHLGLWPAWATVLRGWMLAAGGEREAGTEETQRGDALMAATGARFLHPFVSALLAEQFAHIAQIDRGLALVTEALAADRQIDMRWCDAELHRLRGELLLRKGVDGPEIESAYRRAIAVAQVQQAKAFELRATTSLARLWHHQGRRSESRQLLTHVYDWFTEGFDTPDLKAARALLNKSLSNP